MLDVHIQVALEVEKGRAGSPRLLRRLKKQRHRFCKFKATTNSNPSLPVAANLLQQNFSAERPYQEWVSEITQIPPMKAGDTWPLILICTRVGRVRVDVGSNDRLLVCDALRMAIFNRDEPHGVIVYSDRGGQYCSKEHRKLLDAACFAAWAPRATGRTMPRRRVGIKA